MINSACDEIHIVRQGYDCKIVANGFYDIGDGFCIDDRELLKALTQTGEFYPFTCGCGIPECAGIKEPLYCTQNGDIMHWLKKSPPPIETFSFNPENVLVELEKVLSEIFDELFEQFGDIPDHEYDFPHGPCGTTLATLRQTRDLCRKYLHKS